MEPFTGGVNTPTQSVELGTPVLSQVTVIQSPVFESRVGVAEMLTEPAGHTKLPPCNMYRNNTLRTIVVGCRSTMSKQVWKGVMHVGRSHRN